MAQKPVVKIEGLPALIQALKAAEANGGRMLSQAWKRVAERFKSSVSPLITRRTGRLADTLKTRATQKWAAVQLGSSSRPYAGPWDFGGWPKGRPYVPGGRVLYPAAERQREALAAEAEREMEELLRRLGLT